jgi:hypothetical protein
LMGDLDEVLERIQRNLRRWPLTLPLLRNGPQPSPRKRGEGI